MRGQCPAAPAQVGDARRVTAMVDPWRNNCVGDLADDAVYLGARFGELAGDYVPSMSMDGDHATNYSGD